MRDGYKKAANVTISGPPPRPPATAYSEPGHTAKQREDFALWKVWLVCGDCILIGLQPILVHLSKNGQDGYSYHPVSVNVMVEAVKTSFALIVLLTYGTARPGVPMYRSLRSFLRDARLNRALLVPAFLYSVNGYLKFMMQLFFKPTTAKMLGNLKVLVIAVLMKLVLKRTFTWFQWEALLLLCVGITINQLDHCTEGALVIPPAAIFYTSASLIVPSLASIFNEWALKRHMETSVHLQNFYLYFFGLSFNTVGLLAVAALSRRSLPSLFQGHSKFTLMLVVNNALQGILSSFFFKYADTLLKKYSSTIATIFTALVSAALFGHNLTLNFLLAVITVFCSMHIFFGQGGLKRKATDGSTAKWKEDPALSETQKGRSSASAENLLAMEADFADPDNVHLVVPRRSSLLPR